MTGSLKAIWVLSAAALASGCLELSDMAEKPVKGGGDNECPSSVYDFDTCLNCYCEGAVDACDSNYSCVQLVFCLADCDNDDSACQQSCTLNYEDGVNDLVNILDCRDSYCFDYMS